MTVEDSKKVLKANGSLLAKTPVRGVPLLLKMGLLCIPATRSHWCVGSTASAGTTHDVLSGGKAGIISDGEKTLSGVVLV